ncbi:hypothetical protein KGF56_000377 [Candida oxycetoniae]|uniref:Phospholipid/glycerol acyltransferase domain-containing protein n=1 Tax=Candida oxycetoniae TaxID=497107 RepID=A0AAI9WZV5_9ASCO|nr:uncharacterized protein KGF56_000377 [Candida oxycetoniae]KAI3406772.2 hypothetical protein KGF56_000377 [Candida oxycetoniae]
MHDIPDSNSSTSFSQTKSPDIRRSKLENRPFIYYLRLIFRVLAYDAVLWFFNLVIQTFFRDVQARGSFNIPKKGPVIFVIAPHHNQFVDGLVVMTKVKENSNRRIAFLIAQKSYDRFFIGHAAKLCSAIPVRRAQDLLKRGTGTIYLDDNDVVANDKDNRVIRGKGTHFTTECQVKGLIGLPDSLGNSPILEIVNDEKLILKKPFGSTRKKIQEKIDERLHNGTTFKIAPHIDNHVVFHNVFNHLNDGKVLGIFPEGGSHDRPDLLPLKPGVAIMALGAVAQQIKKRDEAINIKQGEAAAAAATSDDDDDDDDVTIEPIVPVSIVPVGLNYFHPHKFRSRVVIEFGKPIIVDEQMAAEYSENSRESVDNLLKVITLGLKEVTVTCNDYETLMVLQAVRRLYTSGNRETIPLPMVIEMNRRLIKGYEQYKDRPDVKELKEAVLEYNRNLMRLNLHDHQVESLNRRHRVHTTWMFITRFFKFFLFMGLSMPGIFMFSPVFIISRRISRQKAKEALAGSVVKIEAKDVLSTWKILVALGLAPMLYIFWSVIGTILIVKLKVLDEIEVSVWFIFVVFYLWAVLTTYASLRIGEIGVDYYKSLKPLFISMLSINSDKFQIEKLKKTRRKLCLRVNEFCNKYGPEIFDDFNRFYRYYNDGIDVEHKMELLARQEREEEEQEKEENDDIQNTIGSDNLQRTTSASSLDLNLSNLADIPIFASADLEQTSDVNSIRDMDAPVVEQTGANEKSFELANGEAEDNDTDAEGPKMRLRKAMQKKLFET